MMLERKLNDLIRELEEARESRAKAVERVSALKRDILELTKQDISLLAVAAEPSLCW